MPPELAAGWVEIYCWFRVHRCRERIFSKIQETIHCSDFHGWSRVYGSWADALKMCVPRMKVCICTCNADAPQISQQVENKGAFKMAKNEVSWNRTKQIDSKYHLVLDLVENKELNLKISPISKMPADMFTKPIQKHVFDRFVETIRVISFRLRLENTSCREGMATNHYFRIFRKEY